MAENTVRTAVRAGMLVGAVAMAGIAGVPAAGTAGAEARAVQVEPLPRTSEYVVAIRAPRTAEFSVTITTGTAVRPNSVPAGCIPGTRVVQQVVAVEDQAPAGAPVPARSVVECALGPLDAGAERRVILPVDDLHAGTREIIVELSDGPTVAEQFRWEHRPFVVCAPFETAPAWTNDVNQDPAAPAPARATGHIAGTARPGARITLTGIDACEHPIDRSMVVPDSGEFRFTGLIPGHYGLLDGDGRVLRHVELSDGTPGVEDLVVAEAD